MPEINKLFGKPTEFFSEFDEFLNDHIGGSFEAIKFRRKTAFRVFNSTGDLYIVGDNTGAMFLTAPFRQKTRSNPFQWWENICVKLQKEGYQKNYLNRVLESKKVVSSRGAKVIYTSIPSTPVLIPDQFPASTPSRYREACQRVTPENNHIRAMQTMNPDIEFFYPLQVFKEKAKDPYFYPNNAYHWKGESAWVFIEEFAKKYDLELPDTWPGGPCEYKMVEWDIGQLIGVGDETRGCDRNREQLGVEIDPHYMYPLNKTSEIKYPNHPGVKVVKMTNPNSENDKVAIIFSNSFGPEVREQYAALFHTTYHLRLGVINTPNMKLLLRETDILDVDIAIFAIADFHYPNFLIAFESDEDVL